MADPPKSRGPAQTSKPPPIPQLPIAPAAATTEVVGMSIEGGPVEEHSEITKSLDAPIAGEVVGHMLELVASEAEALLVGENTEDRLGDLNVRTALASWDALHQTDEALRYLELAENHPLAARLQISAALARPSADLLAATQRKIELLPDTPLATLLFMELTEAWLFRFVRPELATNAAERIIAARHASRTQRERATLLATFAYAACGAWSDVVRMQASIVEDSLEHIAATAALILDRRGDVGEALQRCWAALQRRDIATGTLGLLRVIDVAVDAAARAADPRLLDLLGRRAELVGQLPGGALEALATRHAIASGLARDGQLPEATALWTQLADDPTAAMPGAARRIAILASAWSAAAAGDVASQLAARKRLADSECTDVTTVHAWRTLELAAASGESAARLGDLAHVVTGGTDHASAEWWLDLVEYGAPTAATVARFEARGGLALRSAAALAEQLGNVPRALELWRRTCTLDERLDSEYDHVVRLLRSRRDDELADAYTLWALAERDGRTASALQCARGVVDLVRGDFVEAEETLQRAADLDPRDVFCRAALAAVYRSGKRFDRLTTVLAELSTTLESKEARASIAREYAELLGGNIGDRDAGLDVLERAIEGGVRRPEVLREAARLQRDAGQFDKSLEHVRAELATDPPIARRVQLLIEQAECLTVLDQDPHGVVASYLEVLDVEPGNEAALTGIDVPARAHGLWDELARAYRGAPQTEKHLELLAEALEHIGEWSELAELRRRQIDAAASPEEKSQIAAELARLYEVELGDHEAAIRTLALAHAAMPDDAHGHELLRLLRENGRWSEMATLLERELERVRELGSVIKEVTTLLDLGELYTDKLDRAADALAAYESILAHDPQHPIASERAEALYVRLGHKDAVAGAPPASAALDAEAAALHASRGNVDAALAAYLDAFAADPANRDVFTAMERVCFESERWGDVMQLYDAAIKHVENGDSRSYRLADLYSRRGNIELNLLGKIDDAIASYQKVVAIESNPAAAVQILEDVCKTRGNWDILISAWERRADHQRDPQRRVDALRTAGMLASERMKDVARSMQLTRKLLDIDPKNSTAAALLEAYYEDQQDKTALAELLKLRLQHAAPGDEAVGLMTRLAQLSEEGARDVHTAIDSYLKVLEAEPENREALDALGRIYESTEQWSELIDVTRRLIKVTTDRNTKALLYFKCGSVMEAKFQREQDAIRFYDAAIKTSAHCLPAVHGLRDLYRRRKEWQRVLETLEAEVKLWSDDKERAGVLAQIGGVYAQELDDPEQAMAYYEQALQVDPDSVPANQALFDHFFEQGEWDKALPVSKVLAQKAARDGDPATRSEFYRKRGVVARMTGDARVAADSLIVALELKPLSTKALDDFCALAHEEPDAWDFESTYRDLEKIYRKRDDGAPCLARVIVARAAIVEREGDLDAATELYREALALAPTDFTILSALVEFHADMRHWRQAVEAIERYVAGAPSPEDRLAALMRQAEIHADGELNPLDAIAVLSHVLQLVPTHQDAHYQLAQQYFLVGRYGDARAAIERVIQLATAPGMPLSAEALARYYYFKGRILDASGDPRAAAPQYRRAIEYAPGYAPPALVLARRAAEADDQRQAETLLIDAAHAAMEHGGPGAAVALQRGLARILLASGDRPAAIEAYRGILNVEPDSPSDRVALAEIYAVDDMQRAISELRKVLDRDIHHAPAYRLLASYYHRLGDTERAARILTALDSLGFAEEADRQTLQHLRMSQHAQPVWRAIDTANRDRLLVNSAPREPLGEVWSALAQDISELVTHQSLGENVVPVAEVNLRVFHLASDVARLFEVTPEVFVGDRVPGLFAVSAFPTQHLVIDRTLLDDTDLPLRFLFGYAFEAIRGRYAGLLQLGARQRRELGQVLRGLLSDDPTGPAARLLHAADDDAAEVLERHAGTRDVDPGPWIDTMLACAKRGGLVACDDFAAAIWMVARLAGEILASHDDTVALGAVLGGPDLVRFYLSDSYQLIRDLVATPS
jgi:tetratricopeptide (TPR) repeat protein